MSCADGRGSRRALSASGGSRREPRDVARAENLRDRGSENTYTSNRNAKINQTCESVRFKRERGRGGESQVWTALYYSGSLEDLVSNKVRQSRQLPFATREARRQKLATVRAVRSVRIHFLYFQSPLPRFISSENIQRQPDRLKIDLQHSSW